MPPILYHAGPRCPPGTRRWRPIGGQIAIWRRMTQLGKARLVTATSRAVQLLSLADIRRRHPEASEEECLLRLARLKLGPELFALAHPEIDSRLKP